MKRKLPMIVYAVLVIFLAGTCATLPTPDKIVATKDKAVPTVDENARSVIIPLTTNPPLTPTTVGIKSIRIFLIALENGGQIGCGDSLVPVERPIPPTQAPLTAALHELLAMKERTYGQAGLYNALYQSDLQLEKIDLRNRKATIRLRGQYQTGGVCDDLRVKAQLEQTVLQFATIDHVELFINDRPLEVVTSER